MPRRRPPHYVTAYDHFYKAMLLYRRFPPEQMRKKAGTLSIRLRAIHKVYFERTGQQLFPLVLDQMLKAMEGMSVPPRPKPRPVTRLLPPSVVN